MDSKPLRGDDESGAQFAMEMLAGDKTYGINLDRLQWNVATKSWVVIELLKRDPKQPYVTPFTSHPNRYYDINPGKWIGLWRLKQALNARLYLVNYASQEDDCADEVLLMAVSNIDPETELIWKTNRDGKKLRNVVQTQEKRMTRVEYSTWFRALNQRAKTSL